MAARFAPLLAAIAMAVTGCSTAATSIVTPPSATPITADQLALFAAYVALDRTCGTETSTSSRNSQTYEACMRRSDMDLCSVTEADWSDLQAALITYGRPESLGTSRALVTEQCGAERAAPIVEHERWRVTDRCQTTGPFLRALVRSRWIQEQSWSSDRKAREGGWCSGNLGFTYFSTQCGDFLLSQRRAGYRPPARIYGHEGGICGVF